MAPWVEQGSAESKVMATVGLCDCLQGLGGAPAVVSEHLNDCVPEGWHPSVNKTLQAAKQRPSVNESK